MSVLIDRLLTNLSGMPEPACAQSSEASYFPDAERYAPCNMSHTI